MAGPCGAAGGSGVGEGASTTHVSSRLWGAGAAGVPPLGLHRAPQNWGWGRGGRSARATRRRHHVGARVRLGNVVRVHVVGGGEPGHVEHQRGGGLSDLGPPACLPAWLVGVEMLGGGG